MKDFALGGVKLVKMHPDEPELIRRAQRDRQAFGALYDRYMRRIYAFAYRCTGDTALAQDVTAATFEKALRHLGRFRWQGVSFGAWLYRIARNEIMQAFRRARFVEPLSEWHVADEPSPDDHQHDALYAAFAGLSASDRELLTLRFFEEMSSAEVAQVLGCSVNNVYMRLHRALGRLRQAVEKLEQPEANHV